MSKLVKIRDGEIDNLKWYKLRLYAMQSGTTRAEIVSGLVNAFVDAKCGHITATNVPTPAGAFKKGENSKLREKEKEFERISDDVSGRLSGDKEETGEVFAEDIENQDPGEQDKEASGI